MDFSFRGVIFEWRGPAPFYFVAVPDEFVEDIRAQGAIATYGWGMVPVHGRVENTEFSTTLFPRDGGYVVPLKRLVREPFDLGHGDEVTVEFSVTFPG